MVEKNSDTIDEEKVREYIQTVLTEKDYVSNISRKRNRVCVAIKSNEDRVPIIWSSTRENIEPFHVNRILSNINEQVVWLHADYDELHEVFFEEEETVVDEVKQIIDESYDGTFIDFEVFDDGFADRGDIEIHINDGRMKRSFVGNMRDGGYRFVGDDGSSNCKRIAYFDTVDE